MSKENVIQVMTDVAIFSLNDEGDLMIALVKRRVDSVEGNKWALPGVIVKTEDQTTLESAKRAINKTGLTINYIEEFGWRSGLSRDPARGWTISVVYMCLVEKQEMQGASWFKLSDVDALDFAFDHREIIDAVTRRLKNKVNYSSLPIFLMPSEFSLPQLQLVYEKILGLKMKDKAQFRSKILEMDLIEPNEGVFIHGKGRAAQAYKLKKDYLVILNKNLHLG